MESTVIARGKRHVDVFRGSNDHHRKRNKVPGIQRFVIESMMMFFLQIQGSYVDQRGSVHRDVLQSIPGGAHKGILIVIAVTTIPQSEAPSQSAWGGHNWNGIDSDCYV